MFTGDASPPAMPKPKTFYPKTPPFAYGEIPNPTIKEVQATAGAMQDYLNALNPIKPYSSASFVATQNFRFHCNTCMDAGEYQHLADPYVITRVTELAFPNWRARVFGRGYQTILTLLP